MDRPLASNPLRARREVLFLLPRRPSTFNDLDPTTTQPPSVPTRPQESESLPDVSIPPKNLQTNSCSTGPIRPSSPSPPSQDTAPISAPPPSPAHLPSVKPNEQRRMPQRRRSVEQRPRRLLLRRTNRGFVDEGDFCE